MSTFKKINRACVALLGELSRLSGEGNPGKRDNFSSYKRFGSPNRDTSRRGECHVMPRFRVLTKHSH